MFNITYKVHIHTMWPRGLISSTTWILGLWVRTPLVECVLSCVLKEALRRADPPSTVATYVYKGLVTRMTVAVWPHGSAAPPLSPAAPLHTAQQSSSQPSQHCIVSTCFAFRGCRVKMSAPRRVIQTHFSHKLIIVANNRNWKVTMADVIPFRKLKDRV